MLSNHLDIRHGVFFQLDGGEGINISPLKTVSDEMLHRSSGMPDPRNEISRTIKG
jgi:hypothetical protein